MDAKNFLIYGISKGLGRAIALNIPTPNDYVFGISRTKPDYLDDSIKNIHWISADLSNPIQATNTIKQHINHQPIDCLIYNVGIWENNAFSEHYNFETNSPEEIEAIVNTNITSCILAIQSFLDNLKSSKNAKIILIGSTWGLDNHKGMEVTFSATKFALRGIVHALRENLRQYNISISILNLGYLATEFESDVPTEEVIKQTNASLIPLQDVLAAIRFILCTSAASCVKEITMPAMKDNNI